MTRYILIVILVVQTIIALGQQSNETEKHPIDIKLKECLLIDSNYITRNTIECEIIALEEWDKEMLKFYKLLIDTLDAGLKEKLRTAQRKWLAYKHHEIQFIDIMYESKGGTMWKVSMLLRQIEITRQRAIELKTYYDMLTFK